MNRWIAALSCVALASCGGTRAAPSAEASSNSFAEGLYEFSASTPNQVIRGNLRFGSAGTGIQFQTPCQSEATVRSMPKDMPTSSSVARYYCSGSWLTFDRSNPALARWYASVEIPRRHEVCSRYDTQNGRQVCVSWTTETYYVAETRSGGIQVRRIP